MTESISIESLLQSLLAKTTTLVPTSFTPNMRGATIYGERRDFTNYAISPEDFERILTAIDKQKLFVYPIESMMGFVDGYRLYDINMLTYELELLMAFSQKNIPFPHTLETLFPLCHTEQNKELLYLIRDKNYRIKEKYTDYDYGLYLSYISSVIIRGFFYSKNSIYIGYQISILYIVPSLLLK